MGTGGFTESPGPGRESQTIYESKRVRNRTMTVPVFHLCRNIRSQVPEGVAVSLTEKAGGAGGALQKRWRDNSEKRYPRRGCQQEDDNRLVHEVDEKRVPAKERERGHDTIRQAPDPELPDTVAVQVIPATKTDKYHTKPWQ